MSGRGIAKAAGIRQFLMKLVGEGDLTAEVRRTLDGGKEEQIYKHTTVR